MNFTTVVTLVYLGAFAGSWPAIVYYAAKRQELKARDYFIAGALAMIWPLWWFSVFWDDRNPAP